MYFYIHIPYRSQLSGDSLYSLVYIVVTERRCHDGLCNQHKTKNVDGNNKNSRPPALYYGLCVYERINNKTDEYLTRICTLPNAFPVLEDEQRRYITHTG